MSITDDVVAKCNYNIDMKWITIDTQNQQRKVIFNSTFVFLPCVAKIL